MTNFFGYLAYRIRRAKDDIMFALSALGFIALWLVPPWIITFLQRDFVWTLILGIG